MNYTRQGMRSIILLLATVVLSGCDFAGNEYIEGTVVDMFGNPLEGVVIKISNSAFETTTDSDGAYALDYVPGALNITYTKDGYTSDKLDIELHQKAHFPAQEVTLYTIPVDLHLKLTQDLHLILTRLESRIMAQILGCLPVLSSLN